MALIAFWESVIRSQQHAEISQREAVARISSWSIGVLLSIYDGQCTKCIAVKKIDVSWCWLLCYLGCRAAASFTKTQLKRRMKHRRLRHENRSVRYRNRCFDSPIYKGVGVCYVLVKMPISRPYSTYQQSSITTTVAQRAYAQRVFGSCYYIGTGITYRSFYLLLSMSIRDLPRKIQKRKQILKNQI